MKKEDDYYALQRKKNEEERKLRRFRKAKSLELSAFKEVLKDAIRFKEVQQLRSYFNEIEERALLNNKLTQELKNMVRLG